MHYHEFRAMNTEVILAADGSGKSLLEGFNQSEKLVRSYEHRFTRFSEDSELSALNRSAGTWFQASPDLYEVVELAVKYYVTTGGLFNPGILGALEKAGYDRSFNELFGPDSARAASSIRVSPVPLPSPIQDFGKVELEYQKQSIKLPKGLRIDLGGIAKGWIAEQTAHFLSRFSPVCAVNAGGDQFAIGTPQGESGWLVSIEDPYNPNRDVAVLNLPEGAMATSTTTRRVWEKDGVKRHHLIDPRTGNPAQTEWVSVTVVTDHTSQAEILAKAILIGGTPAARTFVARYPDIALLTIDAKGRLAGNDNSRALIAERFYARK